MNKIEQDMCEVVIQKRDMSKGNTCVIYVPASHASGVFLHENHLGNFMHDTGEFVTNTDTLREFPTVTTISRLKALGVDIHRTKKMIWLDGECICAYKRGMDL